MCDGQQGVLHGREDVRDQHAARASGPTAARPRPSSKYTDAPGPPDLPATDEAAVIKDRACVCATPL
jgi:hypothetical protein